VAESRDVTIALLEFERQLQICGSPREVAFSVVNESSAVLKFDQAVIWRLDLFDRPVITAASGLADVSGESPYLEWLGKAIRAFPTGFEGTVRALTLSSLPDDISAEGAEWCHEHLVVCRLRGPDGLGRGGIVFSRSAPFADADMAVFEWITRSAGFALWAWRRERNNFVKWIGGRKTISVVAGVLLALAIIGNVPVSLNALASAEITPLRPIPVTSPMEGVVKQILVKPNEIVKAGAPLVALDDTSLRNRLLVAQKALEIARADSQRAVRKAFSDEASRTELQVLQARVEEKSAEVTYVSDMLERLVIEAPQGGLAIFANAEEWTGQPVRPGERIMMIADPSVIGVTIYMPPDDVVDLEPGAAVSVFLNVDPLNSIPAKIVRSSYEAMPMPEGTLAYVINADLEPGHGFPRIGMRGTAKVYSSNVTLAYYLLRKPIAFVRRNLGL
jgi:multidrug resistance efflux pump